MHNKIRTSLRFAVVCAVFLASAVLAMPAYADDGLPPVETPTVEQPVQLPGQDSVEEEATPPSAPEPDSVSTDTLLPELPAGTEVIVLDEEGEALPLATEEAAEVIAFADPIWCPANVVTPTPGMNGCTQSFGQFVTGNVNTGLLDYLMANQPGVDGVIWIEKTYNGQDNAAIVFNGNTTLSSMANFKLTFKGGWNGAGTSTLDALMPSTFDVSLVITGWKNDVSLNNILVTGTAAGTNALEVQTTGKIIVKDVKSSGNTGNGANFDNSAGTATVTVTNSQFNNNTNAGLKVKSKGIITLTDVIANNNTSNGATLENNVGASVSAVSLTGTNIFSNNNSSGLVISSFGAITASNVFANSNAIYGAYIFNSNSILPAAISLTGTNHFKYNGTGLYVSSKGQITMSNIAANFNTGSGAYLTNISGPSTSGITFTGTSSVSNNGTHGLQLNTLGTVLLNNLTADNNGTGNAIGDGLVIHNESSVSLKNVTLTGLNSFSNNYGVGIAIYSSGVIVLNNVTASGNKHNAGALIDNTFSGVSVPKNVTLAGVNAFSSNYGSGIIVDTHGAVLLNNVTADNNGTGVQIGEGSGADIDNSMSTNPQAVTLAGINSFSGNYFHGLNVLSKGVINVAAIKASDNITGHGAKLDNTAGISSAVNMTGINVLNNNTLANLKIASKGAVTLSNITANDGSAMGADINNSSAGSALAVTLTGVNNFNNNNVTGLLINSRGAIILNTVTANGNTAGFGAELVNTFSINSSVVTLIGKNTFNNNGLGGLDVDSKGAVTASSLTASSNQASYGVFIDTLLNVTLTGTNIFNANANDNLRVQTSGTVSLSNINATGSVAGYGAYIDNTSAGTVTPKTVTLLGVNIFSSNALDGLAIYSNGAVITTSVTANGNTQTGIFINNVTAVTPASVTLNGVNVFNQNMSDGLKVTSKGLITTTNLTGNSNNGYAAILNNFLGGTAGITMNGSASFAANARGLDVQTNGVITGANLSVSNTGSGVGANLYNGNVALPMAVKLSGVNTFNNNSGIGLQITSSGAVTLNSVTASNSATDGGVTIANSTLGNLKPQAVTFTGFSTFNNNSTSGLTIETYGAAILNGINSNGNGAGGVFGYGAYIDAGLGVTLNGSNTFNGNKTGGLYLTSKGSVLINTLSASNTLGGDGVYINNMGGTGTVKLTGSNTFNGNSGAGLEIESKGAISLNNLTANNNTLNGTEIANFTTSGITSTVTLTGLNTFNDNGSSGLKISSKANISLVNVIANSNMVAGMIVDNSFGTGSITITGINEFIDNSDDGARIFSNGAVTISKVTGDNNGKHGINIATSGKVSLTCGSFVSNIQYGVNIVNAQTATLSGVISAANTLGDVNTSGVGSLITIRNCPLP